MNDTKLVNLLSTLDNLKPYANSQTRVSLTEDEYKLFVSHPRLKAYLFATYPVQMAALQKWIDTPTKERIASQKPFWPRDMSYLMPQKVVLFYNEKNRLVAEIINWNEDENSIIDVCAIGQCTPPLFPGALYAYDNPSTGYLAPVFVDNAVPPYRQNLAVFQLEQSLRVMQSPDGLEWAKQLEG